MKKIKGKSYDYHKVISRGDEDTLPLISPKGYWRGYLSFKNIQLVNREDGTCSFYYLSFLSETAVPIIKGKGYYKIVANTYHAIIILANDYIVLETTGASSIAMWGTATLCSGGVFTFEVVKHI